MCYIKIGETMNILELKKDISIKTCTTFKDRFIGFMFKKNKQNYGLHFPRCNSVHTFFCFQDLDIYMTDKDNNILYIYKNIKPNRIILPKKGVINIYEFSTDRKE